MLSRKAVKQAKKAEHGRHIYAYCNRRTKQVLYSLERALHPSALKQLPDIGANFTPPSLRKDVWQPLFSVQLPDTPEGREQGLHAFKMLREYRRLHETMWEPPMELSLKFNEKRKEQFRKRLENRGGDKTEFQHDLMKREKKKMRQRIIMDQKANSVADLAAVLLEQGDQGKTLQTQREQEIVRKRELDVKEMLKMAEEAKNGKIEKLRGKKRQLIEDMKEGRLEGQKNKTRLRIQEIATQIEKTQFAVAAVAWAQLPESRRQQEVEYWMDLAATAEEVPVQTTEASSKAQQKELRRQTLLQESLQAGSDWQQLAVVGKAAGLLPELPDQPVESESTVKATPESTSDKTPANTEADNNSPEEVDYAELLPSFPPKFDPLNSSISKLRKHSNLRKAIRRKTQPVYTAEGIIVRWANTLDAEYAELWPQEVEHVPMGIVRNTHPKPLLDEPIEDLNVFKALGWKHRKQAWELEPDLAEPTSETLAKVQEIREKRGLVDDPWRPKRLVEEEKLSSFVRQRLAAARSGQITEGEPVEQSVVEEIVAEQAAAGELTAEESTTEAQEPIPEPPATPEEPVALSPEEQQIVLQEAAKERKAFLENLGKDILRTNTRLYGQGTKPDPSQQTNVAQEQRPSV